MNYNILFFTGTGGTKLAAEKLGNHIVQAGFTCTISEIGKNRLDANNFSEGMLIVMYAVHAFGAPIPVYKFIEKLKNGKNRPSAVISISAGGDVPANAGCRIKAKRKLRQSGFNVVYEDMIMMPSNWAVKDPVEIENLVINSLDDKIEIIANRLIESNDKSLSMIKRIPMSSRLMAAIGTFSRRIGFPLMGKCYKADDKCNGCSICANQCPQNNIEMNNGKPHFGWRCLVCMRCIYGCPQNAISAGIFNFIIVKEGYDIARLTESARQGLRNNEMVPEKTMNEHQAVKQYLEEIKRDKIQI